MKKFVFLGIIILISMFVAHLISYYGTGFVSQKNYAKDLVKEELDTKSNLDKYKILEVTTMNEMEISNAAVMGLPYNNVTQVEVDVAVRETSVNGIESENHYYHMFFKPEGENDWQYGRKISNGNISGTQQYQLEKY
ncbi:hypothetical protein [Niallia taxi]|uniref:hypothetical protein n=1 Tax=Niallia taxi TaxID=2499688 RepID=UPI002E1FED43|nr:hypothetical protein [Niallia taxi]